MDDSAIEMTPPIGSDGEPVYCATDPDTSPAQPSPPQRPLGAFLIVATAAGMVLLVMTGRLK